MCSRRARIWPPLETSRHTADNLAPASDATPLISPTNDTPNKKRLRNWRRSTGPLSSEELHLAMLETEKEIANSNNDPYQGENPTIESKKQINSNFAKSERVVNPVLDPKISSNPIPILAPYLSYQTGDESLSRDTTFHRPLIEMDSSCLLERRFSRPRMSTSSCNEHLKDQLNYKMLYENEKNEKELLKEKIQQLEFLYHTQCVTFKSDNESSQANRINDKVSKDIQALNNRVTQLEEEVKAIELLQADNIRLKEENGALIRVISRLSK